MSSHLSVGISKRGRTAVVVVAGELDIASAPVLQDAIERARQEGAGDVVVDLADLAFMDVGGLRVLIRADRRAEQAGGRLTLANVRGEPRRLLTLTGAIEILKIGELPAEPDAR